MARSVCERWPGVKNKTTLFMMLCFLVLATLQRFCTFTDEAKMLFLSIITLLTIKLASSNNRELNGYIIYCPCMGKLIFFQTFNLYCSNLIDTFNRHLFPLVLFIYLYITSITIVPTRFKARLGYYYHYNCFIKIFNE